MSEPSPPITAAVNMMMLSPGKYDSSSYACWWCTNSAAGDGRHEAGDGERGELGPHHAHAERLRRPLVLPQREQHPAGAAVADAVQADEHEHRTARQK